MSIKHWPKATPAHLKVCCHCVAHVLPLCCSCVANGAAHLKATYGGLERKDPKQQHATVCGTHYLVPDPVFRRELDAVRR